MKEIQKWKVGKMVEFIRCNEASLDWADIHFAESWNEVLAEFGIVEPMSEDELQLLKTELLEIAATQQTREIARMVWSEINNPIGLSQSSQHLEVLPEDWAED